MLLKKYICILFLLAIGYSWAQENPLLKTQWWNQKPSIAQVKEQLKKFPDVNAKDHRNFDVLSYAILRRSNMDMIRFLVDQGANVNSITHHDRSPIFWAATRKNLAAFEYLLEKGARVDIIEERGYSLLMYTAASGVSNSRFYELLEEHGVAIKNEKHKDGRNALLMVASAMDDLQIVDYFVKKGLSLDATDKQGNNILAIAAQSKNLDIVKGLVAKGIKPNTKNNAFIMASRRSRGSSLSVEFLQYLESLGYQPNTNNEAGITPLLQMAYGEKDVACYKYFIEKGVDPLAKDEEGNTALARAAYVNSKEVVDYLISVTPNINVANKDGATPLSFALRRNSPEVISLLIEKGANVHLKDNKNNDMGCALVDSHRGDIAKFKEKMALLTAKGYNPKKASVQNGNSLLQVAVRNGNEALLQEVLTMGINVNYKNQDGYTPLHVAAMTAKNSKLIQILLDAGADKNMRTEFEESAYDLAKENEVLQKHKTNLSFLKAS